MKDNQKKVKSEKKEFIKLKKGGFRMARVYEEDFRRLLREIADKAYEEAEGESNCCTRCGVYSIELETACNFVREIADKTEEALRKKSYINHHHRKENGK